MKRRHFKQKDEILNSLCNFNSFLKDLAGNLSPALGARNQVGIGLSYRPASLCSLVSQFQTRFVESIPRPIAGLKITTLICLISHEGVRCGREGGEEGTGCGRGEGPEPLFLNVYGAQESIPRNEFREPM
jgi:hypothetical protein